LVWRARGGELKQVDPGDEFILDGSYFKEHPTHILGTEGEASDKSDKSDKSETAAKKRLRYHVIGDFTGFPRVHAAAGLPELRHPAPADL
jgi:hypothetical protein